MGRAALLAFSCIALGLFVCTGDEVFDLSGPDEDHGNEQKFKMDWQRMHKEARETIQSQKSSEKSHKREMMMLKDHTGHKAHNAAIERGVKKAAVNNAAVEKVKNALATATKCQDVDMEGFSTKPVNLAKSAQDPGLDLKCGKIRDGKFEYKFRVGRCKPGRLGGTKYFISGINVCGVVSSRTKMAGGSAKRGSKKCVDIWEGANCAGAVAHGSCRFRRIETMCCASCKRAPGKTQLIGTPMAQLNDIVLASSACSGTECLESKAFVFTAFSNHVNSFIPAMQANMMELGGCFSSSHVNRTKPLCPGRHHMLTAKSSSRGATRQSRRARNRKKKKKCSDTRSSRQCAKWKSRYCKKHRYVRHVCKRTCGLCHRRVVVTEDLGEQVGQAAGRRGAAFYPSTGAASISIGSNRAGNDETMEFLGEGRRGGSMMSAESSFSLSAGSNRAGNQEEELSLGNSWDN